jgi:hypothetical protein
VLLEGDKGGKQLEGVAMKGTIARRFEELDWDNNGQAWLSICLMHHCYLSTCAVRRIVLSPETDCLDNSSPASTSCSIAYSVLSCMPDFFSCSVSGNV